MRDNFLYIDIGRSRKWEKRHPRPELAAAKETFHEISLSHVTSSAFRIRSHKRRTMALSQQKPNRFSVGVAEYKKDPESGEQRSITILN